MKRPLAACALWLALAAPAGAAPFVFASGATLRGGATLPLVLPDGSTLPASRLAAQLAARAVADDTIVAFDLGRAGTLFIDGGGADWPAAPFVGDPVDVWLRAADAIGFTEFPEADSLAVALAVQGTVAFRTTCPRGLACPQDVPSVEVFADGFEAP